MKITATQPEYKIFGEMTDKEREELVVGHYIKGKELEYLVGSHWVKGVNNSYLYHNTQYRLADDTHLLQGATIEFTHAELMALSLSLGSGDVDDCFHIYEAITNHLVENQ